MIEDTRLTEILVVDDNRGDAILAERAFRNAGVDHRVTIAETGEKALSLLEDEGPHASRPLPDLILLDLNLPKLSGMQVLARLKDNEALRHIPVIILSASSSEHDIRNSYGLHATGYALKPDTLVQFRKFVEAVQTFFRSGKSSVERFAYPPELIAWL